MLEVRDLKAGYGKKQVLHGVSLDVREGEIVALIGPNGAGKSTLLKAIFGIIPVREGEVVFGDEDVTRLTPTEKVGRGMAFCPQGNRVFGELSVRENLELAGSRLNTEVAERWLGEVFGLFPVLKERLRQEAGSLSNGERQMLVLARALLPPPLGAKLVMINDEPSLGLAPDLIKLIFQKISQIAKGKKAGILIVEQKVRKALAISDRVYSMKMGKIAFAGHPEEIMGDREKLRHLFL